MNKHAVSAFFRKLGLIRFSDTLRFYLAWIKTYPARKKFLASHENLALPPAYYLYETFNLNYHSFYNESRKTAQWLIDHFNHFTDTNHANILDWGCGPGRIIRHLRDTLPSTASLSGTDYNEKYIKWCRKHIQGVRFKTNELDPPMNFENDHFDIIFGISIFTHLSATNHYAWFDELIRVTKPGGIIFLTLHGTAFRKMLSQPEKEVFNKGEIVIQSGTKEGHRTYGAFHPEKFVRRLIGKNLILEHIPGEVTNDRPQQDVWIIRKAMQ